MLFEGQEWNEAEISDPHHWSKGVIAIMAFDPDDSPKLIGTGFVVQAEGLSAIAITAAHNFDGVRKVIQPLDRHHPTAPQEFCDLRLTDVDRRRIRAFCVDESGLDLSQVLWAAWDTTTDIGMCKLSHQNNKADFF